jgi:hypothetical protein
MTIKLLTFKTNHTLIGDLTPKGDYIILKKPVQVIVQATKDGPAMGFVPFLEYSEEFDTGITFHVQDILCTNTPITELTNEYNKMFGSGIQIASAIPKF